MRGQVPGDPASLTAAGTAARRATRDLELTHARGAAAYASLGDVWGTSTSVRTRKEGLRALAALADGGRHTEMVGAALQEYAAALSELQARQRRIVDAATAAGLEIVDGRIRPAWGVTGEANAGAARRSADVAAALQGDLDAVTAQQRRRRDLLLDVVRRSSGELEELARALRLA